jgi:opacity protein-like surface antigen
MSLTPAQLQTLKTAILANPALAADVAANQFGNIALYYNEPSSPTFIVWRTSVRAEEIGNAWNGSDISGMSSLNMQRLQLLLASSPSGVFDMSREDRRAGFEGSFGTNQNNASRVAMRAVWKRTLNRVEALFATGTGSDASPGIAVYEGEVTPRQIVAALES